jgi:hypothetical protein
MDDVSDDVKTILENQAEQFTEHVERGQWNYAISTARAAARIIEEERGFR